MAAYTFTCDTGYITLNEVATAGVYVSGNTGTQIKWMTADGTYRVYVSL